MTARQTRWQRWKTWSAAAARVQARILFSILYVLAVVPIGWMRYRSRAATLGEGEPAWQPHADAATDLDQARRQF